jgi:predicted RND superfamily exporter protein
VLSAIPPVIVGLLAVLALGVGSAFRHPAWVIAHARGVLIAIVGLSAGAALALIHPTTGAPRVGLDASEQPLMVREDPARSLYEEITRRFGHDDQIQIAMSLPSIWTADALAALRDVTRRLAELPHVRRVESLANTPDYRYDAEWGGISLRELIEELPAGPAERAALRDRVLADPVHSKLWVSPDGSMSGILISLAEVSDQELIESGFHEALRAALAGVSLPGLRWHIAGRPHVKAEAVDIMVHDLRVLIPLSVAVASVVVWLLTRSLLCVALPLAAALLATLWTFASLAVAEVDINLVTIVLGPTLISLGGLYGVHVVSVHRRYEEPAATPRAAALSTLRYVRLPVLLAGLSTCAGFSALLLAGVPATAELGLFGVVGIGSLTFLSLTALPCCLALGPKPAGSRARRGAFEGLLRVLGGWVTSRPGAVLGVFAGAALVAALLLPRVVVDTDYLTFFDADAAVRRDFRAIAEGLVGPTPLYLSFQGSGEGTFRAPEQLRALAAVAEEVESLSGVDAAFSMVSPIRKLNRALEHNRADALRIPDTPEEVSDAVFLIPKRELRRFATSNHRSANIIVRTERQGSRELRELARRVTEHLEGSQAAARLPPSTLTGNALVLNRSADFIAGDQARAIGAAALTIFLLVGTAFGSWRTAALAMVPNLIPVLLFFGLLGAGTASLSLPTGLIGCLSLGVALDDTLHFLNAYRSERDAGSSPDEAARLALQHVGRAIAITSAMLVAGFASICLSGFATIREFGALTATVMAVCLVTDLLLFPALLVRFRI